MGGTDRRAVAILAKAPRAGRVKTRLCPPLSADEAADLSRCFLLDSMDHLRALDEATLVIAYAPAEDHAFFEEVAPDLLLIPQRGPDLGTRLANVFDQLLGAGFRAVLAIGTDTPTLPGAFVRQALDVLDDPGRDVVLGPTEDGGYYLVGVRTPCRDLFDGVPWSTDRVFEETMRRARAAALTVAVLPRWYDIDTAADLRRLRESLAGPAGADAPHTREFLAARLRWAGDPA